MGGIAGEVESSTAQGGKKKERFSLRKKQMEKALWARKATQGDVPQARLVLSRMLENRASRREPVLCGFCKCSHAIGWKLEARSWKPI